MKFKPKNLYIEIAKKGWKLPEFVDRMNQLQEAIDPTVRPITYNAIYVWNRGTAQPAQDKAYMICAVLGIHPKKLYEVEYNEDIYLKYLDILFNL